MTTAINARRLRWAQIGAAQDFSGGPNIRDAPSELAPNEATDSWNVTYDERGGVQSRLGYTKANATAFSAGAVHNVYWSPLLAARLTHAGKDIYVADTNTSRHTFTTSDLVTFAELNNHVVACHPVDGLFTSTDGVTWTVVGDPDAPKGTCVAVWQNKLFVGASTGTLYWSDPGDPTAWTSTSFVKVWEKDQQPIVALHIGSGQDILGLAALLVFKQESFYRVNDSSTGSYTTVDATIGAAGPLAVTGVGPKVLWLSKHGIYWWANGVVGAQNGTGDRLLPLWNSGQLNLSQQALWAAGRKGTRCLFSLTLTGSSVNNLAFEYHPDQGWSAPGSNAMSCYTAATGSSDAVYGGSPTVSGRVYQFDQGGSDDGTAIAWRFQTRWFEPAGGMRLSVWRAVVKLRGAGTMTVRSDEETSGGKDYPFDTNRVAPDYDDGFMYDAGYDYAIPVAQSPVKFFSLGTLRQLSFRFTGTSNGTSTGTDIFGNPGSTVGAFGMFGIAYAYWWQGFHA